MHHRYVPLCVVRDGRARQPAASLVPREIRSHEETGPEAVLEVDPLDATF